MKGKIEFLLRVCLNAFLGYCLWWKHLRKCYQVQLQIKAVSSKLAWSLVNVSVCAYEKSNLAQIFLSLRESPLNEICNSC